MMDSPGIEAHKTFTEIAGRMRYPQYEDRTEGLSVR